MTFTVDFSNPYVLGGLVGVFVWLVGLEWRFRLGSQKFRTIEADLKYIRSRIDRVLNHRATDAE